MSEKTGWKHLVARRYNRRTVLSMSARAGVGAAGLALVGCGDDDDDEPAVAETPAEQQEQEQAPAQEQAQEQAEPEPQAEEEMEEEEEQAPQVVADVQLLNVDSQGEPDSLDPQRATDTVSIALLKQLYSPLVLPDETGVPQAVIASEVPTVENGGISEDGLTYTFRLKPGLVWSDGAPLVAENFVTAAKRLFEPGSGNFYVDFYRIIGAQGANQAAIQALSAGEDSTEIETQVVQQLEVTAPDDLTVVYQLTSRSPVFLLLVSLWPLYPTRQDLIDEHGDSWTEAGNHVSNGSFTLASWNHEQDITLVRNNNAVVQPRLETVFVDQITERNIALLAYQEGELDVAVLGPEEIAQARDDETLTAEAKSYAQQVTLGVYYNFNVPSLTDKRVRQALSIALDRDELVAIVLEGAGIPAYSWLPPGVPGHDNDFGRALYENRPIEDAQAMLAEAGFPGGEGLSLEVLISDSSTSKLVGEWFKEQWESKLGISIELIVREVATYFSERNQGLYQLTTGGWGSDYSDPQNWMPLFQTGGLLNSGDFSNADYDALLAAADSELDSARRIELYEEANQLFMEELPFAPTYFRRRVILTKPYVQGLMTTSSESAIPGDDFLARVSIQGKAT